MAEPNGKRKSTERETRKKPIRDVENRRGRCALGRVEMNAVELVREVVEITVGSGMSKSVWTLRNAVWVEGDSKLQFGRGGRRCSMKFLDAHVKRAWHL